MNRKVLLLVVVVVAVALSVLGWRIQDTRVKAAKVESEILKEVSAEELVEIVRSQGLSDPEKSRAIVATTESRRGFAKGLREYLALASRARREGMAEDPAFALNLENKSKGLIAGLYASTLGSQQKPVPVISQEQVDAVWADPVNERQFKSEFDALATVQRQAAERMESTMGTVSPLQGEALEKTRKGWAKTKLLADIARADGDFIQQPIVKLRLKILEAGVLSAAFLAKHWMKEIRATDAEISDYIAAHPEYDPSAKKRKADDILRRVLAGEDVAKLAKEFSEDRGSRDNGGLYADYASGGLWAEVEVAVRTMKKGEIADHLIETKDGFHIVQFIDLKGGEKDPKLTIRHILIQRRFEDPSVERFVATAPAPFKTSTEIAKAEIEKLKRQRFIDRLVSEEEIKLPEDFEFPAPDGASGN